MERKKVNSNVQCQKLAVKVRNDVIDAHLISPVYPKPMTDSDISAALENDITLSASFKDSIRSAKKVLFLVSADLPNDIFSTIIDHSGCADFSIAVIGGDADHIKTSFSTDFIAIDPSDINKYDFFGTTKVKTPIFLHKSYLAHDLIVTISITKYDNILGFSGGKSLIFPGLAPDKSKSRLFANILDDTIFDKSAYSHAGAIQLNPANTDIMEAVMVARSETDWFAVNIIIDDKYNIVDLRCGDLFMSHLESCNIYDSLHRANIDTLFDGLVVEMKGCLQDNIELLENASASVKPGGRILISGGGLKSFGNQKFRKTFDTNAPEDIFRELTESFSYSKYLAFRLKKLAKTYHIAIESTLDSADIRQCGLNPLIEDDFLKNCGNVGRINDAIRFTA